jgi:hypothetical protein
MVAQPPPEGVRMTPQRTVVPAGTVLWRCHETAYVAYAFNRRFAHPRFGGNRFAGTTDDPYPYLYLTREPATALAEVFLRSAAFAPPDGVRIVPLAQASRYSLSQVRTTAELTLVRLLTEEDLAGVFQTGWLLEAEAPEFEPEKPEVPDYACTRYWSSEIRRQDARCQGLVWPSRRHRPREAMVLFGDRCGTGPLAPAGDRVFDLARSDGLAEANRLLAPLRAVVVPTGWDEF